MSKKQKKQKSKRVSNVKLISKSSIRNYEKFKNNPIGLFEELYKERQKNVQKDKKVTQTILYLNKNKRIDICDIAIKAIEGGFSPFHAHFIIEGSIPFINHNLQTLVEYLKKINTAMEGDLYSENQYNQIEKLTIEQPKFARKLLGTLVKLGEPFIVGYIVLILENLPSSGLKGLHQKLLKLTAHAKEPVVQGAIIALGRLKYDQNKDKIIIEKTFKEFDRLLDNGSENIIQTVTRLIGNLFYLGSIPQTRFLELSRKKDPKICFEVSLFLFHQYEKILNTKWFEELLMTLSISLYENKGILDNIDHVLSSLLENEYGQNLIEQFFNEWLLNNRYSKNEKFELFFKSTVFKLCEKDGFFNTLITKYLLHEDFVFNRAAAELIKYTHLNKKRPIIFDHLIIKALDIKEIIYLCTRLHGYLYEANTLCSLNYSILESKPNDPKIVSLICTNFLNQIRRDYPRLSLDFLKEKLTNGNIQEELKVIVLKLVNDLEAILQRYQSLPRLNELFLSKRNIYQIALEESKNMNEEMEKTQNASRFMQIVKKTPLKNGKSWVTYSNGSYSTPSKLSRISHSVDVPMSEAYNPVNGYLERLNLRMFTRGDL